MNGDTREPVHVAPASPPALPAVRPAGALNCLQSRGHLCSLNNPPPHQAFVQDSSLSSFHPGGFLMYSYESFKPRFEFHLSKPFLVYQSCPLPPSHTFPPFPLLRLLLTSRTAPSGTEVFPAFLPRLSTPLESRGTSGCFSLSIFTFTQLLCRNELRETCFII